METALSHMAYRVGETLAKTELYFPATDLQVLGLPTDSAAISEKTECMARGLLLRAEIRHGERYVSYTSELDAAIRAAQYAAHLFHLLAEDSAFLAALPLLRRVTDAADRVIVRAAKILDAPVAETYERGNQLVIAQAELDTAGYKALALLRRRPAMLPMPAERMARAAVWSILIAAETCAHVALEGRGLILPSEKKSAAPLDILKPLPTVEPRRQVAQRPRHAYTV